MPEEKQEYPQCFGELDTVFPIGAEGLRCTPETCMRCGAKTECLRAAMGHAGGIGVREEMVDRAYASGRIGFIERWAKRKTFHRQRLRMKKTDCRKEGL